MMILGKCTDILECYNPLDKEFTTEFTDKALGDAFAYLWGVPIIFGCIAAAFI